MRFGERAIDGRSGGRFAAGGPAPPARGLPAGDRYWCSSFRQIALSSSRTGGAVDTVDRMFCLFPLFLTSQMPRFAQ
ncbi:hypothetical protein KH017_06090 [bacterium]|nr:hypothetical protein [bacterium]